MTKRYALCSAIFLVLTSLLLLAGCASTQDILNLNLRDHNHMALHIHPVLEIEILGEKQAIPANMGISDTGMRVIHTHDDTGKVHVESPYLHQFYLKDIFTVWGWTFNSTQLLDHKVDGDHHINVYVDGHLYDGPNPGDLPLEDGKTIKMVYS